MPSAARYTVPEAEAVTIALGLYLLLGPRHDLYSPYVRTDSQTTVTALGYQHRPQAHIHDEAHAQALEVQRGNRPNVEKYNLLVYWTAAHMECAGNEEREKRKVVFRML